MGRHCVIDTTPGCTNLEAVEALGDLLDVAQVVGDGTGFRVLLLGLAGGLGGVGALGVSDRAAAVAQAIRRGLLR